MKKSLVNRIGKVIFIVGILMLVAGLLLALTPLGAVAGPYLITWSILVNALGITMLGWKTKK